MKKTKSEKTCGGNWKVCPYAGLGSPPICKYKGYCDFQLPRDSRFNEDKGGNEYSPIMPPNKETKCYIIPKDKIELDEEKIRVIIEDSKLYQGFQCKDYTIRAGVKEQLIQALTKADIIKRNTIKGL